MSADRDIGFPLNRGVLSLAAALLLGPVACSEEAPAPQQDNGSATGADGDADDEQRDEPGSLTDDDETDTSKPVARGDGGGKLSVDAGSSKPKPEDASSDAGRTEVGDDDAEVAKSDATTKPADPGGDFPRADEVNVAAKGPYKFAKYTEGLSDPAYASSVMYYPEGATPPFAAIVFSPGFTATKESYTFLGEMLASHGFAVLLTTPTSTSDQPSARGKDLEAAVARIGKENERAGGPLEGKLAADRICITGHSMGGGGTLHGATALGDKIRCAVPLQPWQPGASFAKVTAPTLFIAAQSDTIAGVGSNAAPHYASIPDSVEKIYAEFKGADHFLSTNRGTKFDQQAHYMVAFYKLQLEDDDRYSDYLYGDKQLKDALSKYETSQSP